MPAESFLRDINTRHLSPLNPDSLSSIAIRLQHSLTTCFRRQRPHSLEHHSFDFNKLLKQDEDLHLDPLCRRWRYWPGLHGSGSVRLRHQLLPERHHRSPPSGLH